MCCSSLAFRHSPCSLVYEDMFVRSQKEGAIMQHLTPDDSKDQKDQTQFVASGSPASVSGTRSGRNDASASVAASDQADQTFFYTQEDDPALPGDFGSP